MKPIKAVVSGNDLDPKPRWLVWARNHKGVLIYLRGWATEAEAKANAKHFDENQAKKEKEQNNETSKSI